MLFLVISTPAPTRPSEVREARRNFWPWAEDKLARGIARSLYPRAGRGVVAVFDVDSHETLHRLLNEWSDLVPAEFALYPLMEPESIVAFLAEEPGS
jgi:muconolactone delta-isomerase